MDIDQFYDSIIIPALTITGLDQKSSYALMLGTAILESDLVYLEHKDPKRFGFYAIDSLTHKEVQKFLNKYDSRFLKETCLSACFYTAFPSDDALIHNLRYSTIVARLQYYRKNTSLPNEEPKELANYYCKYYRCKGNVDLNAAIKVFEQIQH